MNTKSAVLNACTRRTAKCFVARLVLQDANGIVEFSVEPKASEWFFDFKV